MHLKRLDWILILAALLLIGFGLISLYSSSLGEGDFSNFKKQIAFLVIGFLLMIFLSFFNWRQLKEDPYLALFLYSICLISLVGLFFLAPSIRGVRSWYRIGQFSFEPIEFTKMILIIVLAKYFSKRHIEMYRIRHILLSGFYVLVPLVLVFLQPDFGQILITASLWMGVLVISGIKIRHFLILCLCGFLIFALSWTTVLRDYQKERIISMFYPVDPLGASWSQNQAKIAVGSGGLLGQGIGKGSQTQYGFLPEPQTDFIFASIAEETGLLGIAILLSLFLFLFWRMIKIAVFSQNNFSRLFGSGLAILLAVQVFIHVGMNIGILPIVGIPLPLISYGGSSLISTFIAMGILQSIKIH